MMEVHICMRILILCSFMLILLLGIDPNEVVLFAEAGTGLVGFIGGSTNERYIVGRSSRPVAVGYDPIEQVLLTAFILFYFTFWTIWHVKFSLEQSPAVVCVPVCVCTFLYRTEFFMHILHMWHIYTN